MYVQKTAPNWVWIMYVETLFIPWETDDEYI